MNINNKRMEDTRRADLRQLEDVMKEAEETTRADKLCRSSTDLIFRIRLFNGCFDPMDSLGSTVLQKNRLILLSLDPMDSTVQKRVCVSRVYGDKSVAEALRILFKSRIGVIVVVERQTQRLIGSVRNSDVYLLMENDKIFHDRKTMTVEEFIHRETTNPDHDPTIDRDTGAPLSAGMLRLLNEYLPRMDTPVTNKKTNTLKQAMKNVAGTKSDFSFQVDGSERPQGVLTLRDIILQFAPPSMNSNIDG
ncbi:putative glucose-1-phosphate adenylyltransferase [Hibiscus syriacus]|uniref:Glucose-1-phosphate adenylyltransferase n=1 Tax=Hibiscus syriacus TaxID=106335 RepID=A0A6A2XB76_HIBSY|nr:putative glucose-1-phosphate adenylyltransferase [Hibiscus syriacus]